MLKKMIILTALCPLLVAVAAADDLSALSDRDLKQDLRNVQDELRKHENLQRKLSQSESSSSNAARRSAIDAIQEHMRNIIFDRENVLGQEHTIKQHGGYTTTGTTDAAEVGTPIANKKTRRRVRKGEADEHPNALRRLTRMQTIGISSVRLRQPAIEKQGETFDHYVAATEEFASILQTELNVLLNERQRRAEAAAAADTLDDPEKIN
jgi:hypothetical protein